MDTSHFAISEKLASYRSQIDSVNSAVCQRDLRKLYEPCFWTFRDLDNESVTCRRIRKITPAYLEIRAELEKKFENLDRYIMWANLM